jgi:hypothetical protein
MEAGIVSLQPLYVFVREHAAPAALNGRSAVGRQYFELAKALAEGIAPTQGFYLWGSYDAKGLWHNVYLGKAGFGKTAHLRARILEELKDERCCLWQVALTKEELMAAGARHYAPMWHQYEYHWKRAFRKAGTTHIVWVGDSELSNAAVPNIESDLIETLNPTGNVSRPIPPVSLQTHTREIIGHFRQAIHEARERKYRVVPKGAT